MPQAKWDPPRAGPRYRHSYLSHGGPVPGPSHFGSGRYDFQWNPREGRHGPERLGLGQPEPGELGLGQLGPAALGSGREPLLEEQVAARWVAHVLPAGPVLQPAPISKRAIAYLIDNLVLTAASAVPLFAWLIYLANAIPRRVAPGDEPVALPGGLWLGALGLVVFVAATYAYRPIAEYYWGKTLGKTVVGIRVVMENGSKPSKKAVFLRFLLFLFVDGLVYGVVGLVLMMTDGAGLNRRLGDRLAHTVVVEDVPVAPHAGWESAWSAWSSSGWSST